MKKFTLVLAACAIALSGAAQKKNVPANVISMKNEIAQKFSAKQKYQITNVNALRTSVVANTAANKVAAYGLKKATAAENAAAGMENAYINFGSNAGVYSDYVGLMSATMLGAAMSIDGNNVSVKLYEYSDLAAIKGTIDDTYTDDVIAAYAQYGIAMKGVIFKNGQTVGEFATNGVPYSFAVYDCDIAGDATNGFTFPPSAEESFVAYYIPDFNQLMFVNVIGTCLQMNGQTALFDYPLVGAFYVEPASGYTDYMHKATVTGTSYFDGSKVANDNAVVIPMGGYDANDNEYTYYLVKGALPDFEEAWMTVDLNKTGELALGYFQYAGTYTFTSQDGSESDMDVVSEGLLPAEGGNLSFVDYPLAAETDLDYNTVLTGTNSALYMGEVLFDADGPGLYDIFPDYAITYTNELASGINDAKENNAVVAKEYFDLSGRKVAKNAKGLVIEKQTLANGKTVSRKVVK